MSDLADKIPRAWQQFDIRYWFAANDKCPNCGIVLQDMHPMQNLYPHWTGQCVQLAGAERQMKRGSDG